MRAQANIGLIAAVVCIGLVVGCSTSRNRASNTQAMIKSPKPQGVVETVSSNSDARRQIEHVADFDDGSSDAPNSPSDSLLNGHHEIALFEEARNSQPTASPSLQVFIDTALHQNPRLVRIYREYQAAAARSQHIDKLPDPKLGANIFGDPIETAAGSQQANMTISQTFPWLGKLNAQQQQACFEAFAIRAEYAAERLRVISGVRVSWYRLYVIDKQIGTAKANQELLKSLIDVANARIATGKASPGDVLLGTLELSKLEERLLSYRKQRRAVEADINRLVGRSVTLPINSPKQLPVQRIELDSDGVHQIALRSQPEIEAARLRTQAARWGIEVARLSRRPEFMLSASYFFTDGNRPATPVVNVGEDPWAVGVQVSIPLWQKKYDALSNEARWKHQAANATVSDLADRYDVLILDLVTEAERAMETARLYEKTILPQAQQTLAADQESYSNGNVEFDRVIRDYRNLLTLELGYHQAIGELAIANAEIQQAAGRDLSMSEGIKPPPNSQSKTPNDKGR